MFFTTGWVTWPTRAKGNLTWDSKSNKSLISKHFKCTLSWLIDRSKPKFLIVILLLYFHFIFLFFIFLCFLLCYFHFKCKLPSEHDCGHSFLKVTNQSYYHVWHAPTRAVWFPPKIHIPFEFPTLLIQAKETQSYLIHYLIEMVQFWGLTNE